MRWITGNWHDLLPLPWASAFLVVTAVLCGGIVGVERERKQKAVGMRTLALVSLGSAVFTMVNVAVDYRSPIAAQVVSGIGFLGAGVILRGPYGITGLTSAATIWAVAAVGMTVGIGYAGAGLALSFFMLAAMLLVSLGEQRYIGNCRHQWAVVTFRADGGKALVKIEEALDEYRVPRSDVELVPLVPAPEAGGPPRGQLRVRFCDAHRHHREILAYLANMPEIEEIRRARRAISPSPPLRKHPSANDRPVPATDGSRRHLHRTSRGRRGPAQSRPTYQPGNLVARGRPAGPRAKADRGECRPRGGAAADQVGSDGRLALRLLPGSSGVDGDGPRRPSHDGAARAALR